VGPDRSRYFQWAERSCALRPNQFVARLIDRDRGHHPVVFDSDILFLYDLSEDEYIPNRRDPGDSRSRLRREGVTSVE
jgi:hypothetical protein